MNIRKLKAMMPTLFMAWAKNRKMTILSGRPLGRFEKPNHSIRITGYPYGGCIWGTATALSALKRIKPDIVHLQCANGYMVNIYRILECLKRTTFRL